MGVNSVVVGVYEVVIGGLAVGIALIDVHSDIGSGVAIEFNLVQVVAAGQEVGRISYTPLEHTTRGESEGSLVFGTIGIVHFVAPLAVVKHVDTEGGGGRTGGVGNSEGDGLHSDRVPSGGSRGLAADSGRVAIAESPFDSGDGVNADDIGSEVGRGTFEGSIATSDADNRSGIGTGIGAHKVADL